MYITLYVHEFLLRLHQHCFLDIKSPTYYLNGLPEPWRVPTDSWHLSRSYYITIQYTFIHVESTSCLLALKPSYYTIIVQYTIITVRPGNNRLPRYGNLARGNTYFPRIYFPRISDLARGKHPHSAHLCLARGQHPRRPQGFVNLPILCIFIGLPPWPEVQVIKWHIDIDNCKDHNISIVAHLGLCGSIVLFIHLSIRNYFKETPYTTVDVFPVVSVVFTPNYPARAGIPLCLWGHDPDS